VKRLPLLVDALAIFGTLVDSIRVEWVHIGDGETRHAVAHGVRHLPPNVGATLLGHLPNSAVKEYYETHSIDAFVNVSASEGIPVSIMEAQSFGVPVVACAVGGVPEIVDDANGVLLPEDVSASAVAEALASLTNEKTNRLKRNNSLRTWSERFNAERNYAEFAARLHDMLPPTRAAAHTGGDDVVKAAARSQNQT
jgi:colanic acid/amylovoran biosynthesis glycosyltransferase